MSKKMTPCEKLGYKVGDKFTVIKDSLLEKGTIVVLSEDDGSEVPFFTCGSVRRALIIGSDSDVEPVAKLKPAKQALADAIHQNGGWPQDSEWAVQNGDHGRISFSINKPVRHDSKSWMAKGGFNFKIEVCKPLKNWHQNVLSREEYYQAYPEADADGWIAWNGGECPVDADAIIDVKYEDGDEFFGVDADWDWSHSSGCNIVAYRLHKPEVKPEFCESVMMSIPEPEEKPTIEQLAADYRNAKDYAERLQKEAGDASVKAESFAVEIRKKILELQELIGISKPESEPELVIADWRDLRVGDVVECVSANCSPDKFNGMTGEVIAIDYSCDGQPVKVLLGGHEIWCYEVKFISRP